MTDRDRLRIEIVYALADIQHVKVMHLPAGTDVGAAIEQSGILRRYPKIDLTRNGIGIFGRPIRRDQVLADGDRVEIYRPLRRDPKESRRLRASRNPVRKTAGR